ncbi:hypothetical protein G9464_09235 [Halostella sp. JP-L12]|uniref:hypothetical protein n=1 Tax=Halostella TaxID=1843185 RepID=UPI000EF7F089|nr:MULTISPECIES: hypothetical protein [Halostella]NHN47778.1 hypothetical protein [Halostella sp. JP-L12]
MDEELDPGLRAAAVTHVLRAIHTDRQDAEVVDAAPVDEGYLVGVKAAPRGYISTAKYALVTLDDGGTVVDSESCTGQALRAAIAEESEEEP